MDRRKIVSLPQAIEIARAARSRGETVVLCHGCFDLLHPGHVHHLTEAATLGDRLIVSVTGDEFVNKGPDRPLIDQQRRAECLAALDAVAWVVINPRPTAIELLMELKPDVYVKGAEYSHSDDPRFLLEREVIEDQGGRVMFTTDDVVLSSTALIRDMNQDRMRKPRKKAWRDFMQRSALETSGLKRLIESTCSPRVLVIGETILDTYIVCERAEMNGDELLALQTIRTVRFDGGAAIIAAHLAAQGAAPILVTTLPEDEVGRGVIDRLAALGVDVQALRIGTRMPEKKRFMVGGLKVMMLKDDVRIRHEARSSRCFLELACAQAETCEAAIIADYGLGLFDPRMMSTLCGRLRPLVNILAGDVSGGNSHLLDMRGMDLLCPNEFELRQAVGTRHRTVRSQIRHLLEETRSAGAIITQDERGLTLMHQSMGLSGSAAPTFRELPSMTDRCIDALGCGDALLATSTLALTRGGSMAQACLLGSAAAALEAQNIGNIAISSRDLGHVVDELIQSPTIGTKGMKPTVREVMHDQLSPTHA